MTDAYLVTLKTNGFASASDGENGPPKIMSLPVFIGDIVTRALASWLRRVSASAEGSGVDICIGFVKILSEGDR